jgi:hypothetical protein
MGHPPRSRRIRLVIRALLMLLCVFAIPKLASSETDTSTDQDVVSSKQPKVIRQGGGYPQQRSLRLFAENKDCAVAKLDIWLQHGMVTYSASPDASNFRIGGGAKEKTMLIGGKDCLIRVRIQAVAAGTTTFD